jgi:hypothetical protein
MNSSTNTSNNSFTAYLTLYADAKARTKRFAICSGKENPVWYGTFFGWEYDGEQSSGEMAAAKKAVWLASKVKEIVGADITQLTLKVDAEWLTWANQVTKGKAGGGKARALGEYAQQVNVVLNVVQVPGAENPADQYTVTSGFKKWRDNKWSVIVARATESHNYENKYDKIEEFFT